MAGDTQLEAVVAFLCRLTGDAIAADAPIRLRSVQRAAFIAWARKQGIALPAVLPRPDASMSLRQWLAGEAEPAKAAAALPKVASIDPAAATTFSGIGIDIEEVDALPQAADYREHPFYRTHFTSVEIAYCLLQPDARAAFCGIWAAKEAIVKSGLAGAIPEQLSTVEISRDQLGRPTYPGCHLSISHTARTAVAVCLAGVGARP